MGREKGYHGIIRNHLHETSENHTALVAQTVKRLPAVQETRV